MKYHLMHPRDQLVNIMNRIYNGGMTTLSGGNLSIKDENGDIWITPAAVDKGKLGPQDIMCVGEDGGVEGPHRPSSEYPFHLSIYEQRPDLRAIVHAHPPALVSFSIAREVPDTSIIPQAQRVCGPVGYAPYALTGSQQLGDNIAETFRQGYDVVLLENHGIVTGGGNLLEAFQRLETLDFCARTLMQAAGLGRVNTLTKEQLAPFDRRDNRLPEFTPARHGSRERELRQQLVDIIHRACDRQLMISTEGVASARVGQDSFLITPTGLDRRNLDIEDLVLVQNGQREKGKLPSRSVRLHQELYDRRPEINCIILAQSPSAMAFAISSGHFDTRTIPESYILLRSIPRIRHGAQYSAPEEIAAAVSPETPVLIIENDSILVVGQHIMQAFDRLEVAEFSARSLIDTATIGPMVPIGGDDIAALERAFKLN
ncbi:MAG: class II aldolase/adducin family protein [Chloroflexota bacterium]|jgi:L-fuculose-phosphate aldolase